MTSRWTRLRRQIAPAFLTVPFAILALRLFAAQLPTLSFPIYGEHHWRQSDVYSVAYNFRHESADFFHPRIDWNNGLSGVMGMEPPIFAYAIHVAMRLFGDDPGVARATAWGLCMLALAGFIAGLWRYAGGGFALLMLGTLALSPLALFEVRQIQPDAAMVLVVAAAALLFVRASRTERKRDYAAALALFTVGILLKGPAVVVGPSMALFAVAYKPVPFRVFVLRALPLLIPLGVLLAWFAWAQHLNEVYNAGRVYFAIVDKKGDKFQAANLAHVFANLYPTYVNGWVLFPALCGGLFAGFHPAYRRLSAGFLVWLVLASLFLGFFSSRLRDHWYYADVALPPLAYFTAHGLLAACRLLSRPEPRRTAVYGLLGLFVLLGLAATPLFGSAASGVLRPVVAALDVTVKPSWTAGDNLSLLALVSLAALVLWLASPRASLIVACFAFCAVVLSALPRATNDSLASLAARSGTPEEIARYRKHVLEPLREVVDRYSTRADLVVTNRRDPTTLHEAMRKGFAISPEGLRKKKIKWFTRRKALLYIHYGSVAELPPEIAQKGERFPLLAKTKRFRVYCLAKRCPEIEGS